MKPTSYDQVVIFDSACIFCNKSVQFLLKYEKEGAKLYFASMHSPTGKLLKEQNGIDQAIDSIIFINQTSFYDKSDAIIELAKFLKFPANFLKFGFIVPKLLRDKLYDFIAKNRNKLFSGTAASCTFNPEDKSRFLD